MHTTRSFSFKEKRTLSGDEAISLFGSSSDKGAMLGAA